MKNNTYAGEAVHFKAQDVDTPEDCALACSDNQGCDTFYFSNSNKKCYQKKGAKLTPTDSGSTSGWCPNGANVPFVQI
jgi:hypothetical protein